MPPVYCFPMLDVGLLISQRGPQKPCPCDATVHATERIVQYLVVSCSDCSLAPGSVLELLEWQHGPMLGYTAHLLRWESPWDVAPAESDVQPPGKKSGPCKHQTAPMQSWKKSQSKFEVVGGLLGFWARPLRQSATLALPERAP